MPYWNSVKFTVRSLIRVDFPAPFGPMTPTRLRRELVTLYLIGGRISNLDNDRAQLTLNKLGVFLPGYVKVQFVIFKIARVLLRTPMRDPGGGKANLTEVAASV